MTRRFLLTLLFCAVCAPAQAAQCGGLNPVLVSLATLSFGFYSASQPDNTANASVTVSCTVQVGSTLPSFTLSLSKGGGSFSQRQMGFLTDTLNYNIYTSGGYDTIWGDGTSGTQTLSYSASDNLASKSFTAYGKIPRDQYVLPGGPYTDTILITASF